MLKSAELMRLLVNVASILISTLLSLVSQKPWIKIVAWSVTILITIGHVIIYFIEVRSNQEEICSDNYISVRIPLKFKGSFYNPEKYNLSVEVINNQDKTVLLSNIIVNFINQDVFDRVEAYRELSKREGLSTTTYFVSIYENPGILAPKTRKTFNLTGPDFLPKEIEVSISHSNSNRQISCNFKVSEYKNVEYPMPKHVSISNEDLGINVLDYIRFVDPENSKILSILPEKQETLIQENGLFIHNTTEWMLYSVNNMNIGQILIVSANGIDQAGNYDATGDNIPAFDKLIDLKQIKVGQTEALRLADKSKSIYGNSSNGWALLVGWDNNRNTIPIWRLPYIGKDYLNIFVNAENGKILPSMWFFDKYSPMRTISRTKYKENKAK